ncbi:MAG: helix-turn-helix domain-containing protein, partial [Sulfuricurvum sp.]
CSYPEIGDKFGGKDHSTIIHAIKKIERQLEEDYQLKITVENLKNSLTN